MTSHDLVPMVKPFFNAEAKKALAVKTYSAIHQYNEPIGEAKEHSIDSMVILLKKLNIENAGNFLFQGSYIRKLARVKCFGFLTEETKIAEASLKMVDIINHMSKFGYIKASLTDLTMIPLLDSRDFGIKKYAIVSYLAIDSEFEPVVDAIYGQYMFPEGGIPPEFK